MRRSTGWRATIFKSKAKAILINADDLSRLPVAVQRRLLRRAIREVKGDLREIDLFHIDALLRLASAEGRAWEDAGSRH